MMVIEGKSLRVTIMLDVEISKKIRAKQAKLLQSSNKSVSFSKVINMILKKGI